MSVFDARDMDFAITSHALSKRYPNGVLAVDAVQLHVPCGQVYGLLGPNGAGKTTTLRMLVGLIRPSSGGAMVAGYEAGSRESRRRVGALLDRFGFYPYLSGRNNLRVVALYCGLGNHRVELALEEVGMARDADRRYGTYSRGMQQRIALAAVLMREPAVVILDEPTTGLDPQGIHDMRTLIREMARSGRTVLLSSHHLSEVEQTCHTVGVINQGRLVVEGPVSQLRGARSLIVRAAPIESAAQVLVAIAGADRVSRREDYFVMMLDGVPVRDISHALAASGVDILELRQQERSLEDVFFELTSPPEARSA
jgi:ABC-2 type transport system ATP-binding protein